MTQGMFPQLWSVPGENKSSSTYDSILCSQYSIRDKDADEPVTLQFGMLSTTGW